MVGDEEKGGLRDRRRNQTRRTVQDHAMRLFVQQGYDETTITQVAEAAGVSAMTVYRHFPTKEDLVLWDEYDRIIAEHVAASPPDGTLAHRMGRALVETARAVVATDAGKASLLARLQLMVTTPALRARHWDSQFATQQALADALRTDPTDPERDFAAWATAGACQAAMTAALERWAREDGRPDLPDLVARALTAAFGDQFRR